MANETAVNDAYYVFIFPPSIVYCCRRVKFDHLDKAFTILKLDASMLAGGSAGTGEEVVGGEGGERESAGRSGGSPVFRRVDLIVSPSDQYPFALVSWTGSKVHVATLSISPNPYSVIVRCTIYTAWYV